jgi:hypothetical protein
VRASAFLAPPVVAVLVLCAGIDLSPGRADLALEDREVAELVADVDPADGRARAALLEKLLARTDAPSAAVVAALLRPEELDARHEATCESVHFGRPWIEGKGDRVQDALCALSQKGIGFSDDLRQRGCVSMYRPTEYHLLEQARGDDEALRYAACAVLFRARAVRPCGEVVAALAGAPVHRLPWLVPVLRQVLDETSWEGLRDGVGKGDPWSLGACVARRHPEAVPVLARRLDDPWFVNKRDAAWALGGLGDRRAVPALIRELEAGDYWSSADAAESLGLLGSPDALPALREAARTARIWPQVQCLRALGRIGEAEDVGLLEHYAGATEYTGAVGRWSVAASALEELVRRLTATVH